MDGAGSLPGLDEGMKPMTPMTKVWWPAVLSSVFSCFPLVFPPLSSSCACPWFSLCFTRFLCGWSSFVPWSSASCPCVRDRLLVLGSSFPKELDRLVSRLVQKTIQMTSFETELHELSLLWLSFCSNTGLNVSMTWNNIYCICNIFS
ncbi:hypothetical protein NC652_034747 [Populus alba x Populus x berolinensis]|nr:hypothetical protein NC652_034747 [Populus alba x Populus x berolinensis]